jgi:hypothetical protein
MVTAVGRTRYVHVMSVCVFVWHVYASWCVVHMFYFTPLCPSQALSQSMQAAAKDGNKKAIAVPKILIRSSSELIGSERSSFHLPDHYIKFHQCTSPVLDMVPLSC